MIQTLGARIHTARKRARITQRELAMRCGVSAPAVTKWETDETRPTRDNVIKIAQHTNVSLQWLLFGHLSNATLDHSVAGVVAGARSVPVLSISQALDPSLSVDDLPRAFVNFPCGPRAFAYDLPDDSNAPLYPRGSRWIVDPDRPATPGSMVLATRGEHAEAICGELSQEAARAGRIAIITPLNSRWPAARSDSEALEIIAVLSESIIPAR